LIDIVIEPQASLDIEEAARWYENQLIGLGVEFVLEVDCTIEKIQNNPKLYLQSYRTARRALLHRFPYAIYFVVNDRAIHILAVLHQVRSDKKVNLRLL
jgi:plasmid stabilization system protein ParE